MIQKSNDNTTNINVREYIKDNIGQNDNKQELLIFRDILDCFGYNEYHTGFVRHISCSGDDQQEVDQTNFSISFITDVHKTVYSFLQLDRQVLGKFGTGWSQKYQYDLNTLTSSTIFNLKHKNDLLKSIRIKQNCTEQEFNYLISAKEMTAQQNNVLVNLIKSIYSVSDEYKLNILFNYLSKENPGIDRNRVSSIYLYAEFRKNNRLDK